MNTVKKGDDFEKICFDLIRASIDNYELGIIPNSCKVFWKKGYYSRDREKEIIFDISIEVWLPNADKYSLLYLIECKNYSKSVPVDDVEEFYAKIIQVSGVNVKGVFISNSSFMEGGYNFARSKGMMLVQVNGNITLNIILHKTNKFEQEKIEKNIELKSSGNYHNDVLLKEIINRRWKRAVDKKIIQAFINFTKKNASENRENSIPVLSAKQIEEISVEILNGYDGTIISGRKSLNLERFQKYLLQVFELKVSVDSNLGIDGQGRKILSSCDFLTKTIYIDRSIFKSNRFAFIFAHELGHFFLHNKLAISQFAYEKFEDSSYNFRISKYELSNPRQWIEWQANCFASCLIMPQTSLLNRFFIKQNQLGLRQGRPLYVDEQQCNQNDFHNITGYLAVFFNTTKTSVIYRLHSLGLIDFHYKYKSAGAVMRELFPNMFDV